MNKRTIRLRDVDSNKGSLGVEVSSCTVVLKPRADIKSVEPRPVVLKGIAFCEQVRVRYLGQDVTSRSREAPSSFEERKEEGKCVLRV